MVGHFVPHFVPPHVVSLSKFKYCIFGLTDIDISDANEHFYVFVKWTDENLSVLCVSQVCGLVKTCQCCVSQVCGAVLSWRQCSIVVCRLEPRWRMGGGEE